MPWKRLMMLGTMWCALSTTAQQTIPLTDLDVSLMTSGYLQPRVNTSIDGNGIRIRNREFTRGVGTHANSELHIRLDGRARSFTALAGVDDEVVGQPASVVFMVLTDGVIVWESGVRKPGRSAVPVDVNLKGVRLLSLVVTDANDGMDFDHANWVDAQISYDGEPPRAVPPPEEKAEILTPPPPVEPRITGPRVFGARPGHPFLFTLSATGEAPLSYEVAGLPPGLQCDAVTGRITGRVAQPGTYRVQVKACNNRGTAERELRVEIGDRIALTPPLGWNSWNCFAHDVSQEKVLAAAEAMVQSGLAAHGWSYINIDDFWEICPGSPDPTLQGEARRENGRINTNPRFPDMKQLCDQIHALGLKVGIYSSPGPLTCGGCVGSYRHEEQDAEQYAEWGIDYLKYDWCSYGQIAKDQNLGELIKPYRVMRRALDRQARDIVYSLCQYGMGNVSAWGGDVGGNCWRTTGDIVDTWGSMSGIGFGQAGLAFFAEPGRWNDPDMLVVGQVGWGPELHPTRLTPNEQYTHISLWSLLASPLLIGCDMTQMDEFTLSLLTNDEVLDINQDPLGRQAEPISREGSREIWAKPMEDGSLAVGCFNRSLFPEEISIRWEALGLDGACRVRDVWRQQDRGTFAGQFTATVPRHGVVLLRVYPAEKP